MPTLSSCSGGLRLTEITGYLYSTFTHPHPTKAATALASMGAMTDETDKNAAI